MITLPKEKRSLIQPWWDDDDSLQGTDVNL